MSPSLIPCLAALLLQGAGEPPEVSGVYPHLALWNGGNECGVGAVVPWAGSLWAITYSPHAPRGSDDRLYRISPSLELEAFPGSVGGTPASRMIHAESSQLVIGPYFVDREGEVRVVPPARMPGRLTGAARHLFEPARKVYVATMEEGLYEVDVETLEVTELFADHQGQIRGARDDARLLMALPGYHGKGLYSGQGRLVYANNGEPGEAALRRPDVPSGVLAEWDGVSDEWRVVRRAQFCDVRGPGDLAGNGDPETDPLWAIGWDHRSVLLMLLDGGEWSAYRLPKASHAYDGAHGWNTEWPRIRDLGEATLFMNMHGMFWRLPRGFARAGSGGIAPRSTYLKVIGDTARWGDRLVFGCDDAARSEFLNRRRAKGTLRGPGESHSNLWFQPPEVLDRLGPPLGRGAVWLHDDVAAGLASEPFLFGGGEGPRAFVRRSMWLLHGEDEARAFHLELDRGGTGAFERWQRVEVPAGEARWLAFAPEERAAWIRLVPEQPAREVTAVFHHAARDERGAVGDELFRGLVSDGGRAADHGLLLVRGGGRRTLAYAVADGAAEDPTPTALYELDGALRLVPREEDEVLETLKREAAVPTGVLAYEPASILYVDDDGGRWRLPRCRAGFGAEAGMGPERVAREVVTERDLFQCAGLFYELPARNAGGFAKLRPITAHGRHVKDYCSYRGLLVMSGLTDDAPLAGGHVVRAEDGVASLWLGVVDDLWRAGKPVGVGGPWLETEVEAGAPSDPYLMTGFDEKTLELANAGGKPATFTVELEITGAGAWVRYRSFALAPGETLTHALPPELGAYWLRVRSDRATTATAQLRYR